MKGDHRSETCILHDFFLYRGGAERFNVIAAKACGADLAAAYFDPGSFDVEAMGFQGRKLAFTRRLFGAPSEESVWWERLLKVILPQLAQRLLRYAHFHWAVRKVTGFLKEYRLVVFSGDTLAAARQCGKETVKICYFHSIPRYLFDQKDLYLSKVPLLLRPAYLFVRARLLRSFFADLARMDRVYVNSKNLQAYCRQHAGREAEVLYPPVDTSEFCPCPAEEKGDYYISFSKLSTFKRVDRAVQAFAGMPEKKLLVIYGANDPQVEEVRAAAAGAQNIEFRVLENNADLPGLVARAIGTLFVSRNEDFGMVAIESMAAGTPVIGAASGGIQETVMHSQTGLLLPEEFSIPELQAAVRLLSQQYAASMREACLRRAAEFGLERFTAQTRRAFSCDRVVPA